MYKGILKKAILGLFFLYGSSQSFDVDSNKKAISFISEFDDKSYSKNKLRNIFSKINFDDEILRKISRPAEKTKEWYEYREIFLDNNRIKNGITFYKDNINILREAHKKYGIPPEVIVAIIGVETRYGKVMGNDLVITALSTIGFNYPKREDFFLEELKSFLKMVKDNAMDIETIKGSYAGAMGMPQFMPSSYMNYAVDYDKDGKIDLFNNVGDAIFSVANYLSEHGWEENGHLVDTTFEVNVYDGNLNHKPFTTIGELSKKGIFLKNKVVKDSAPVGIMRLKVNKNDYKNFITFKNFSVITRYNVSKMYALAVTQLSEKIRKGILL